MSKSKWKIFFAAFMLVALFSISLFASACSGIGNLRIDAPELIEAELGTYAIPKYNVVDENGMVMSGYTVKIKSVSDPEGMDVAISYNSIVAVKSGKYKFVYTANEKKIKDVTVTVDFADRIAPTINIDEAKIPSFYFRTSTYTLPSYTINGDYDLSKCFIKLFHTDENGENSVDVSDMISNNKFTATHTSGRYQILIHLEDAAGNYNEYPYSAPVDGPDVAKEDYIVYFDNMFSERQVFAYEPELYSGEFVGKDEVGGKAYGDEAGSYKVTLNNVATENNEAYFVIKNPAISDITVYNYLEYYVYNDNDFQVTTGHPWWNDTPMQPRSWNRIIVPVGSWGNNADMRGILVPSSNITNMVLRICFFPDNAEGNRYPRGSLYFSAIKGYEAPGIIVQENLTPSAYQGGIQYKFPKYETIGTGDITENIYYSADGGVTKTKVSVNENGYFTALGTGNYYCSVEIKDGEGRSDSFDFPEIATGVPASPADNKVIYFDDAFGAKQVRLREPDKYSAEYTTEKAYGDEAGSYKLTLRDIETLNNEAYFSLCSPSISDVSKYSYLYFYVYSDYDTDIVSVGLLWKGDKGLKPKQWTKYIIPLENYDRTVDINDDSVYKTDISNLVIRMLFFRSQAVGTYYFSAIYAEEGPGIEPNMQTMPSALINGQEYPLPSFTTIGTAKSTEINVYYTADNGVTKTPVIVNNGKFIADKTTGQYLFVITAIGNNDKVSEYTHKAEAIAAPASGINVDKIAYFDDAFGKNQINITNDRASGEYTTAKAYGSESGSLKLTLNLSGRTDMFPFELTNLLTKDVSAYQYLVFYVYNDSARTFSLGFKWWNDTSLGRGVWTRIVIPVETWGNNLSIDNTVVPKTDISGMLFRLMGDYTGTVDLYFSAILGTNTLEELVIPERQLAFAFDEPYPSVIDPGYVWIKEPSKVTVESDSTVCYGAEENSVKITYTEGGSDLFNLVYFCKPLVTGFNYVEFYVYHELGDNLQIGYDWGGDTDIVNGQWTKITWQLDAVGIRDKTIRIMTKPGMGASVPAGGLIYISAVYGCINP